MGFTNGYTIRFAIAVCVVCSLGVASTSEGLRPLTEANKARAFQIQILSALGLADEAEKTEDVEALYLDRIASVFVDDAGNILDESADQDGDNDLDYDDVVKARKIAKKTRSKAGMYPVFQRKDGTSIGAYAVEMRGKGLWGPISGYLALEPSGRSVLAVTFNAPKETPGLGAEIMYDKFCKQWEGKRIVNESGDITPIDVVKGNTLIFCPDAPQHCVDGVSGATITSNGVADMVDIALTDHYANYLKHIQSGTGG